MTATLDYGTTLCLLKHVLAIVLWKSSRAIDEVHLAARGFGTLSLARHCDYSYAIDFQCLKFILVLSVLQFAALAISLKFATTQVRLSLVAVRSANFLQCQSFCYS